MKHPKTEDGTPRITKTDRDLETFEDQPEKQRELEKLQDLSEKSSGPKKADLSRKIRQEAGTESEGK